MDGRSCIACDLRHHHISSFSCLWRKSACAGGILLLATALGLSTLVHFSLRFFFYCVECYGTCIVEIAQSYLSAYLYVCMYVCIWTFV